MIPRKAQNIEILIQKGFFPACRIYRRTTRYKNEAYLNLVARRRRAAPCPCSRTSQWSAPEPTEAMQRRSPTPFDTGFVHLINLHEHHPQDPHHSTRRHDDLPEAVGIRLGDSRPPIASTSPKRRATLFARKLSRNKQQALVKAAYHGQVRAATTAANPC